MAYMLTLRGFEEIKMSDDLNKLLYLNPQIPQLLLALPHHIRSIARRPAEHHRIEGSAYLDPNISLCTRYE